MQNRNKGITLIALIVTLAVIIVLLGVSINVFVNSDIIGHSEKTGQAYTNALENDKTIGNDGVTINGKRYANMEDFGRGEELIESNIPGGTKVDKNKEYTIEGETRTAVIPDGFTISGKHSERTIEGGLVIYLINDKTEEEIKNLTWSGTTLENLKKSYDQFVWIPVANVNSMFMCQRKAANKECNIKLVNEIPTCTVHSSTEMAGRLYISSNGSDFDSTLTSQTYDDADKREPAIVDSDSGNNIAIETLQNEYNSAVKRVIKSGGFWIGRYETGGMDKDSSNDNTTALNIVAGKVASTNGMYDRNWYRMYYQQKNYVSRKNLETSTIQSTMIFGAAYDQAIKFLGCANETTPTKNYPGEPGSVSTDCYKNVYDLCGNLSDWTTEVVEYGENYNKRSTRGRQLCQ